MAIHLKYILIFYVAFGCMLSSLLVIEYNCEGQEVFPTYYGSPFIFKQKSLASSMEYYYSMGGLLLNAAAWSLAFYLIDKSVQVIINYFTHIKFIRMGYKSVITLLVLFSTLSILLESTCIGKGFEQGQNYWYWNFDQEARQWGMQCKGHVQFLP